MPKTRSFSELRREMLADTDVADHYVEITIQNSPGDFIAAMQHVADARASFSAHAALYASDSLIKELTFQENVYGENGQIDSRSYNPFWMNASSNSYSFGEWVYGSISSTQS